MAHERLISLLTSHRVRIARALVRQVRSLAPVYATVEPEALEQSFQRFLSTVAHLLKSGDDSSLRETASNTAQLRQALGFRVDDYLLAGLSFLPVMRRFLVESGPTVREGLEDYEAFEALAIPLIAETARIFKNASRDVFVGLGDDDDDDDNDDITIPNQKIGRTRSPWNIESVIGGADEELTPFN